MQFNDECKVIIDTLNRGEAGVFIRFLQSEIQRHQMDIEEAKKLISQVKEKFAIRDGEVKW